MYKQTVIYGIVGFVAGLIVMRLVNGVQVQQQKETPKAGSHIMADGSVMKNDSSMSHDTSMSMNGMVKALENKTGDEFDRAFITLMIEHHQGAVEMAQAALKYAGHDEIKSLSSDIISAQTREIEMMRSWYSDWSFK